MEHITIIKHGDGSVTLIPDLGYELLNRKTNTTHTLAVCKEEDVENYIAVEKIHK